MNDLYQKYVSLTQKIADFQFSSALLEWDQETYMPSLGANFRSRQIATLNETAQTCLCDPDYENTLLALENEAQLDAIEKDNVRVSLKECQQRKKLSPAFIREQSEIVSATYQAWIKARQENDFTIYLPIFQKLVDNKRKEANLLGWKDHPYNALLQTYEPDATVEKLDALFASLLPQLSALLNSIPTQEESILKGKTFDKNKQWRLNKHFMQLLGLNPESSRLDVSEHPFTTNFSAEDVRITTRIDEQDLMSNIFSVIHETGHALYEQGLPASQYGLPAGMYSTLSIHESQSRFWENCIGRSKAFWSANYSYLQNAFPEELKAISLEDFYMATNRVEPSLIRTESDELTYHFHIFIRYEIEKQLIAGDLAAADVPMEWNRLYKEYLGVDVPTAKEGCLQDIHWSIGSLGYFATYSLGSLYAAQWWHEIQKDFPDAETMVGNNNLQPILMWLRTKIHQYGRRLSSDALCEQATGEKLNPQYFIDYLTQKIAKI